MKQFSLKKTLTFSIILVLILLPLITTQEAQLTEDEKELLEQKNWAEIAKLSPEKKNLLLEDPTTIPSTRAEMLQEVARLKLTERINSEIFSNKEISVFQKPLKIIEEGKKIDKIKFTGFDNPNLRFTNENTISDGSASLALDSIPREVTEVENTNEGFTLKFGDSEIKYSEGQIDKDLKYTSDKIPSSKEDKGAIILNPKNGKININQEGIFSISGEAKVNVGERTFEKVDPNSEKESTLKITEEGSHFTGTKLAIKTNAAEIKINSETETHILFNRNNPSKFENYIQLIEDGTGNKNLKIIGKDIEVNLLDENFESENILVSGSGENIHIKNGNTEFIFEKDRTYWKRTLNSQTIIDGKVVNNLNGQEIDISNGISSIKSRATEFSKIGSKTSESFLVGETAITDLKVDKSKVNKFLEDERNLPEFKYETTLKTSLATTQSIVDGATEDLPSFKDQNGNPVFTQNEINTLKKGLLNLLTDNQNSPVKINAVGSKITSHWIPESQGNPYISIKNPGQAEQIFEIKDPTLKELYRKSLVVGAYGLSSKDKKNLMSNWCKVIGIEGICSP